MLGKSNKNIFTQMVVQNDLPWCNKQIQVIAPSGMDQENLSTFTAKEANPWCFPTSPFQNKRLEVGWEVWEGHVAFVGIVEHEIT